MRAAEVVLTAAQRAILESLSRSRTRAQRIVERATMIVMAADGLADAEQARRLGVNEQRPRRWRGRWRAAAPAVDAAEAAGATTKELEALIVRSLSDQPRPGGPPKFEAEQVAQLISLACEPPADSGLPVTHWTPAELAAEAVKRGIVESISPRHLDRILKRAGPPPTQESVLDDVPGQA